MADADVIVVGAGLAGLSCAVNLQARGLRVAVLEARDRVGGRTLAAPLGRGVFDLGGQWIGPQQPRMQRLARELGAETFPTWDTGEKVLEVRGQVGRYKGTIPSLPAWSVLDLERLLRVSENLSREIVLDDPVNSPDGLDQDARTLHDWLHAGTLSRRARSVFTAAVRVILGVEPSEVSLLHFLFYLRSAGGLLRLVEVRNGAQQERFVEGAGSLCPRLAAKLGEALVLSAPARRITQDAHGVTVSTDRGDHRAGRVVVAVPPALAGRIDYEPGLPAARDQLTQRFPMGATVKVLALYDRAFWRDEGLSGEAVCGGGPVTVCFDNTSHDGLQPCLLGFVVGREARLWHARQPAERRRLVLESFSRWFGPRALEATHFHEQDWSAERWTRGCPVGVLPPGAWSAGAAQVLRRPQGRIHWAGTETATHWHGFLEGALESAERVTQELLVLP
ncbi:MAG: flavin monoamine oxidase family protein [Deltaproteobacteria bacterium]|nr:flavin monoamine oxidase family protein [Deltaproteobacteria bacterium]